MTALVRPPFPPPGETSKVPPPDVTTLTGLDFATLPLFKVHPRSKIPIFFFLSGKNLNLNRLKFRNGFPLRVGIQRDSINNRWNVVQRRYGNTAEGQRCTKSIQIKSNSIQFSLTFSIGICIKSSSIYQFNLTKIVSNDLATLQHWQRCNESIQSIDSN